MNRRALLRATVAVPAAALVGCGRPVDDEPVPPVPSPSLAPSASAGPAVSAGPFSVLVFTRTAGFRHDSIRPGVQSIRDLGEEHGFTIAATEDGLDAGALAGFRVVIFLNTSGDVLDAAGRAALEGYIRGGGGFVGVHSAADTEYGWPFYGELVGAWFDAHPEIQRATLRVEDRAHPATAHLGASWVRTDEWYNYRTNPRPGVRVLLTLDESTYSGGTMGADHPLAWCHERLGGRAFYTGCGHTVESYADPAFRQHLLGGIQYAAAR